MEGSRKEVRGGSLLEDLAGVHDGDPVADASHDPQIVSDVEDGHLELGLQIVQQVENGGLGGHVQTGGRLVHDQKVRVGEQRHRDGATLEHPSGELVRIPGYHLPGVGHGDALEHAQRRRAGRPSAKAQVPSSHLVQLLAHGEGRVQGGLRILTDQSDL